MDAAKTILVVDDEPMIREAVVSYLAHKGYRVLAAESGAQALAAFERETVSFVVLDLMLPTCPARRCARGCARPPASRS